MPLLLSSPVGKLLLLAAPSGLTAAQRAVRYGLGAAWNLNEASGQRDDAYGTNHLTDVNTVTTNTAKLGAFAAQFTAANTEYLSLADNAAMSTGDVDYWFSVWVYIDGAVGTQCAVLSKTGGTADEYLLDRSTSQYRMIHYVAGSQKITTATTFGVPSASEWHHLFVYHDAANDTVNICGNGGAFNSAATTGGGVDSNGAFALGARNPGGSPIHLWNGRIDAVAFGKSPPGGIAARAVEMRDYFYNGGTGREYPGGWT